MAEASRQNLLSARYGDRTVTIGLDPETELRRLSDGREITCPACNAPVVLHAGQVRSHHFAHLPGAICRLPQSEPETEEHRAGKLLLARWAKACLPQADVLVEAFLPQTQQRADVLLVLPERPVRRIALEFQCAHLVAKEWRRRHKLYRDIGIEDLWFLGGSRFHREPQTGTLRSTELERALFWDNAPLLFLDSLGEQFAAETLLRFRPDETSQAANLAGRLSAKPLSELAFPFSLLAWPAENAFAVPTLAPASPPGKAGLPGTPQPSSRFLWDWLAQRFRVTPQTLDPFFGLPLKGEEAFACESEGWQAAIYYRFVHRRIGDGWWLGEIETWSRAYLPLRRPVHLRTLHTVLAAYQEALAAAGFLSLPMGYGRTSARVLADLTTLSAPPDREEVLRLVRYRRSLVRENAAAYGTKR